ncbi:hypothetical protein FHY55_00230 [Oceanicola sp. D3]|uniref:hypothetical protein n=1 Tax=Oceanicola sp. D3 TaxID=2587163 RepID=UPI00112314C4|nr:hypothetical protein [Oceanicola sp. D3]QDC07765.1 hypothetical protein FHY55_00230 [Oceanicola sp. D3]
MKQSIAAIKWALNAVMIAAMLGMGWLGYKFVTEPGYLAELALGLERDDAGWAAPGLDMEGVAPADDRVVTSRLPQASGAPQKSATNTQRRVSNSSGSGTTSSTGTYAPRTTATDGLRTVRRKKEESAPAYAPPVAQRKVIRVGE